MVKLSLQIHARNRFWILWSKIKLSRNFRCSSGTRSQWQFFHNFLFTRYRHWLQAEQARPSPAHPGSDTQVPTVYQDVELIQRSLLRLSWILCTPAPGSSLFLPMWFLSMRHQFGLGLKRSAGSSDLAQGSCFSAGSGTASTQDFQTLQLFVLNVWMVSLVYQICKVSE